MDDPLDRACENEICTGRDRNEQVQWCEAWGRYLCSSCRWIRNEAELRETEASHG